jgi:hypothetical protein
LREVEENVIVFGARTADRIELPVQAEAIGNRGAAVLQDETEEMVVTQDVVAVLTTGAGVNQSVASPCLILR